MVVVMVAWLALCGCREGGVVGRLWLRWLCEGGGCCEAVDESDVGGGGGGCEAVGPK